MTNRIFFDSIRANRIPKNPTGVMGYDDGPISKWAPTDWEIFPSSTVKVHIAVFPTTNSGTVLDVERYDATPEQAPDWVLMRRRAGVDPTVYMNTSTWPLVRAAFQNRKIQEPHYWVAQYDNVQQIPQGAIGKQYYNNDSLGYDMSVILPFWPGVDTAPQPTQNFPKWPGRNFVYNPKSPQRFFDSEVQIWQQRMRQRGWHLQADGWYGQISAGICLAFQKDSSAHGWSLQEDSIVGEHTWDAAWQRPIS